ncbi:uncharacterized protein [Danio rerio]|uniref:Uncharacterized protein n=1 Tax=Danio rerio TaxID=7955 RepID=A0AC58GN84_DANRE
MELLRPHFCILLLAIMLSLSISSTTNSDPTSTETRDWKGGEGVKRSRVRRQNLPDTLGLPEKTYAFYFLWRLLSEAYDATNRTSAMPATNETTALKYFHTVTLPPHSPKTAQSEESKLVQQSENQTTLETGKVTEQNVLDYTAFKIKIPTKTAEEPLTNNQEQINHFNDTADRNDTNTVVGFFTTISSSPESQNMTDLGDTQLDEQSTNLKWDKYEPEEPPSTTFNNQMDSFENVNVKNDSSIAVEFILGNSSTPDSQNSTGLWNTLPAEESTMPEWKTPEPSQVTEPYIPQDPEQHVHTSITPDIKITTKTAEEPLTNNYEQINHFNDFTDTNDSSTAVEFLFTNSSSPESQNMTELRDTQLDEQSTNPEREKYEPQRPPSTTVNKQLDSSDNFTGTNDSTGVEWFSDNSSTPDTQNTTELWNTLPAEGSWIPEQKTPKPSQDIESYIPQVTEPHVLDSTSSEIKITTKTAQKPLTNNREQINYLDGIADTNDSSTFVGFFATNSSSPEFQNMTELLDTQLNEQPTNPKREKYKPQRPPSTTVYKQMDSSDNFTDTNDSTGVEWFSDNSSTPDTQNTTELWNTLPAKESTIPKWKTAEPSQAIEPYIPQVTEPHVLDSITSEMESPTKTTDEPLVTNHEQIKPFDNIAGTNDSTAVEFVFTNSSTPDSQNMTELGDTQPDEQTTNPKWEKNEPEEQTSTNFNEQRDSFAKFNVTKDSSTAVEFFSANSSTPDTQNSTELWNTLQAEESTIPEWKTPEPSQDIEQLIHQIPEQNVLDSTTSEIKITTKTAQKPLSNNHEQINHFDNTADTNDSSTVVGVFTTISSSPESQNMTELRDTQLDEQPTNPEHEKYKPERPPSTTVYNQLDSSDNFTDTNDSTGVEWFSENSSTPATQNTTELWNTLPAEGSWIPEQKTPKPSQDIEPYIPQVTEPHVLDYITFETKSPTKTAKEPLTNNHEHTNHLDDFAVTNYTNTVVGVFATISSSPELQNMTELADTQLDEQSTSPERIKYESEDPSSFTINEQMDFFDNFTGTNDTTDVEFFSFNSSTPDTQNTTGLWNTLPAEESTIPEQKTPEPSQVTEQHVRNSTISETKGPAKTAEEPFTTNHEKINHFDNITDTNNSSTAVEFIFTKSSSTEMQNMTALADTQLDEQSTNSKREKYETEKTPSTTFHEQINSFDKFADTIDSTGVEIIPDNSLTPQNPTELWNTLPAEESTISEPKTPKPSQEQYISQVTERFIFDTTTTEMKSPTKTAEEPLTKNQEQINNLDDIAATNDTNTVMGYIATISSSPVVQNMTDLGDTQQYEQSTNSKWDKYEPVDALTQPSSIEKLTSTIHPNPKSSKQHISTLVSQESSSIKPPHLHPPETVQLQPDSNEKPTADAAPKESYTNNNLMDKKTQSTTSRTTRISTAKLKTQTPLRKSVVSADNTETSRGFFVLLFTLGCLVLLITALLILVAWRRWKIRHWMNNMWVADPRFLEGTYHSLLQTSSPQTAIEMKRVKTQKKRPESSEIVPESVALQSEHADEDFSEHHARPLSYT